MVFPDGVSVEARGVVSFRQDHVDGEEATIDAGFGVRFDELTPEVRAHVNRFVKASPPMFREPLPSNVQSSPGRFRRRRSMTQDIDGKGAGKARVGGDTLRTDSASPPSPSASPSPAGNMVQNTQRPSNRPAAVTLGFGTSPLKTPPRPLLGPDDGPSIEIQGDAGPLGPVSAHAPTQRAPSVPPLTSTVAMAPAPATTSAKPAQATFSSASTLVLPPVLTPAPTPALTPTGHDVSLADTQLGEGSLASLAASASSAPTLVGVAGRKVHSDDSLARTLEGPLPGTSQPGGPASGGPPSSLSLSRHETVLPASRSSARSLVWCLARAIVTSA